MDPESDGFPNTREIKKAITEARRSLFVITAPNPISSAETYQAQP